MRRAGLLLAGMVGALAHAREERPVRVEAMVGAVKVSAGCLPEAWRTELWPRPEEVTFAPSTLEERAVFTRALDALLSAAPSEGVPPQGIAAELGELGLGLEVWRTPKDTFWVVREKEDRRRGAGAYVIRAGAATFDFIQAPHAYFDSGTGMLGAWLFACAPDGARPRLFATNTAHRFRGRPGETREDAHHPADLAHNPDHLFQWATDLAARRFPGLRVFQLHGFARGGSQTRKTLVAVVSDGSRRPAQAVKKLAGRLGGLLGAGVRLFPDETEILGATQNVQARLLQSYPGTTFVHLELSAEARQALAVPGEVARLGDALLAPFEG